jgi:hypothetical protein
VFNVDIDDLNRTIAETNETFGMAAADALSVTYKMTLSLAFLMVHHQTDLIKVVTDGSLAGPNPDCGPTSFEKVYNLMQGEAESMVYSAFHRGIQRDAAKATAWWLKVSPLLDFITYGAVEKLINDKIRGQVANYLPGDMNDDERKKFLDSIPSTMLNTYKNSLDRVISKMK